MPRGRLAAVVTVVAVQAPTACRRAAGLALRARAPSLLPPPLLPCEGTWPSHHPSSTRRARPPGRCFDRRCTGADLRQARGWQGLQARALASRRRHCCLAARRPRRATSSSPFVFGVSHRPSVPSLALSYFGRTAWRPVERGCFPLLRPPGRSRPHAGRSRHAFDPNNKWQVSPYNATGRRRPEVCTLSLRESTDGTGFFLTELDESQKEGVREGR